MTRMILIRHGETVWNREHRMQGHSDSPLSETGLVQVSLLAQRMSNFDFSALYCSDSGRAQHTARIVAEATGHDLIIESRLRERNFGVFEGLTGPEMQLQHAEAYARFKSRDPHYAVPGGESAQAFRDRAFTCLTEIASRHPGELVVVVTHGLVCDITYREAKGIDLRARRDFDLVNAGINRFRIEAGAWHAEVWGDASHLHAGVTTVT